MYIYTYDIYIYIYTPPMWTPKMGVSGCVHLSTHVRDAGGHHSLGRVGCEAPESMLMSRRTNYLHPPHWGSACSPMWSPIGEYILTGNKPRFFCSCVFFEFPTKSQIRNKRSCIEIVAFWALLFFGFLGFVEIFKT